ncbi:BTAD domain-containing putative transcriptional regulator [Streptomyces capillispiralis]|uniref:AfsR/SARP family transcriptional regulator n=1 Tax=Streptomyces capillispiralis TaxID=68182 RepID=UPI0036AD1396
MNDTAGQVFRVLGPVRAHRGDRELMLGPPRRRAVLAVLLLQAGKYVPFVDVIDAVWGDERPSSALTSLQTHVHHLRRAFADGGRDEARIETVRAGYQMHLPEDALDLLLFQKMAAETTRLRERGHYAEAVFAAREALDLWRGEPLPDLTGPYITWQRQRLTAMRLSVTEEKLAAAIEAGELVDSSAELEQLVADHPLDERFRELLMLTRYRAGRPADALRVYRQAQITLARELGVDPGPALQRLRSHIMESLSQAQPADRPYRPVRAASLIPHQLPAPPECLWGRDDTLAEVRRVALGTAGPVPIICVQGAAGVGKTALALTIAHELAHLCPDGQLYADLGEDGAVPSQDGTAGPDAVVQAWRAQLEPFPQAEERDRRTLSEVVADRRLLLMLDNAVSTRQVRELLPVTTRCVVVVTSRSVLHGLIAMDGAHHLPLRPLSHQASCEMLAHRIGRTRAAAEAAAVRELAGHCLGVPLALSAVAAYAVTHPGFPLSDIAQHVEAGWLDPFRGLTAPFTPAPVLPGGGGASPVSTDPTASTEAR